jgi:hypothetical protein
LEVKPYEEKIPLLALPVLSFQESIDCKEPNSVELRVAVTETKPVEHLLQNDIIEPHKWYNYFSGIQWNEPISSSIEVEHITSATRREAEAAGTVYFLVTPMSPAIPYSVMAQKQIKMQEMHKCERILHS